MQVLFGFTDDRVIAGVLSGFGSFGVDVFFVISGVIMVYALAIRPRGAYEFAIDRIFRLVPAYWVATAVFTWLAASLTGFAPSGWQYSDAFLMKSLFFVPQVALNGLTIPILSVGWSLNYEMYFYAMISAALLVHKSRWWIICMPVLALLPVLVDGASFAMRYIGSRLLWEFLAGVMIGLGFVHFRDHLARFWWLAPFLALWSLGFLALGGEALAGDFVPHRLVAAALLVASALLIDARGKTGVWPTPIIRLGEISYSTYLVHIPVLYIFIHLGQGGAVSWGSLLAIAGITSAIWIVSEFFYRFVERNRVLGRVKRSILRNEAASSRA